MDRPGYRPPGYTARPLIYGGNRVRLLKNGGEYFPRLLAGIDTAQRSVHLETYIFELDAIGEQVTERLAAAARRGLSVRLLIDGFGSQHTAAELTSRLTAAGAQVLVFRPGRWWRLDRRLLRRMHRKIALIDDTTAFIGGINIIDDANHPESSTADLGPRYDFAVECAGPIVAPVIFAVRRLWSTVAFLQRPLRFAGRPKFADALVPPSQRENMRAALLLRDNLRHRRTIERAYIDELRAARSDVIIAMAYFLPGRRFRHALAAAAKRGVRIRLLLQGRVEYRLQHYAQLSLYGELLAAGIEVHEYTASFLHAKVAVVDQRWATVGSSNIDPYSLLFAREANVVVYDANFVSQLRTELETAIATSSVAVDSTRYEARGVLARVIDRLAYRLVRLATVVATRGNDD